MARQKSFLKLKGLIGDLSFYKTRDGYMVREKGGIEGKRIATDPAFERTRENNAEFGRAGKGSKLFRSAFQELVSRCSERRMVGRLQREMVKITKSDTVNLRGERTVADGDKTILAGFEFNQNSPFSTSFNAAYTSGIDRAGGELTVEIPALIPTQLIKAPQGTSHFRIFSGGGEIDFGAESFQVSKDETGILPWDGAETNAIQHSLSVPEGSTLPLFLLLGVEFFQETNGEYYPLKNGAFTSLVVVAVDQV